MRNYPPYDWAENRRAEARVKRHRAAFAARRPGFLRVSFCALEIWEQPIDSVPLAFLDLETTGVDPERDRICEIAIVRVIGGQIVDRVVSLIDPAMPVGASREVHGLDDAMLAGAPALREIAPAIARALDGAIPIGHAVAFDLAFLRAAAARGEIADSPVRALDTRALAQRALRSGSAALAALAGDLALPAPTHRAEPDVIATRALFDRIAATLRPATARHLELAQDIGGKAALRDDLEALLAEAIVRGHAVRICYRVPGKNPFVDLFDPWVLAPPRIEGWMHARAGQRALRGDRILWAEPTDQPFARPRPEHFAPTIPRPS